MPLCIDDDRVKVCYFDVYIDDLGGVEDKKFIFCLFREKWPVCSIRVGVCFFPVWRGRQACTWFLL